MPCDVEKRGDLLEISTSLENQIHRDSIIITSIIIITNIYVAWTESQLPF